MFSELNIFYIFLAFLADFILYRAFFDVFNYIISVVRVADCRTLLVVLRVTSKVLYFTNIIQFAFHTCKNNTK